MTRSLLSVAAAVLLSAAASASAEVVVTMATPPGDVRAGADVPVTLYFMNAGTAAAAVDAPAAVPAKLSANGSAVAVTLRRSGGAVPDLTPGQFAPVAYVLTVPPGVAAGSVVLELDRPGAPRTAFAVAGPPPAGPSASVPAPVVAVAPASRAAFDPTTLPAANTSGIAEYVPWRFSAHEPIYFVAGADDPIAKFQVSFKYQVFDPESDLGKAFWPVAGVHVAYSQTSLWDLAEDSAPFFDSSYRPEVLWVSPELRFDTGLVSRLGVQVGLEHESNGKSGADSRSMNFLYVRPSVTLGDRADGLFVTLAPKVQWYVLGFDDGNDDIKDYRGYGELSLIAGWRNGLQLRTTGRVGDDWDKGSVQFDVSYPLGKLTRDAVDLYLHAQYFNGFGESLVEYNESTSVFRMGLSIVR